MRCDAGVGDENDIATLVRYAGRRAVSNTHKADVLDIRLPGRFALFAHSWRASRNRGLSRMTQGQREADFPRRMFTYAYRLYDRYARDIAGLAVLADASADWRPDRFEIGRWGSRLGIRFPSVKLLDYASRQAELEAEENPFATVVLAHLAARETRGVPRRATVASSSSPVDSSSGGCRASASSTCTGFWTGSCDYRTTWSCNTPMRSMRSRRT